jgi:histidine triad (HIT) family protein
MSNRARIEDGGQPPCIFCDIVAGRSPARIVAEDDRTLAFLDIFPLTRGHTLVIPKAHADDVLDAPPDDVAAVARTAQLVAQRVTSELGAPGVNLLQATGVVALQTVFHLHMHVLPRYPDDGFVVSFDRKPGDPAELDELATRLSL